MSARTGLFLLITLFIANPGSAQPSTFPANWAGNWKGELRWYSAKKTAPQNVMMELRIRKEDTSSHYSWQLVYGADNRDNRPYSLIPIDSASGHWAVDEHNGIVIDQFWVGDKFCSAFKVQQTTIVNNYWLEGDKMVVEFCSFSAKPVSTTGAGTDESPLVESYRVTGFQRAILARQ